MDSIPKKIHYCWFGGKSLGSDELRCIESWRKFFPGYDIVRWDESNFDVRCCPYVSQAYDARKWAFVSDYARFAILYEHGGLYFDTDVEVIRPMDDIIANGPFMGFETDATAFGNSCSVNPGLGLSANPGLCFYKLILNSYKEDEFIMANGTINQTTVVVRTTNILRSLGLKDVLGIQKVEGITIYPSEYFNPKEFYSGKIHITENTRSIHHFSMSWFSKKRLFEHRVTSWGMRHGLSLRAAGRFACLMTIARYADISRAFSVIRKQFLKDDYR